MRKLIVLAALLMLLAPVPASGQDRNSATQPEQKVERDLKSGEPIVIPVKIPRPEAMIIENREKTTIESKDPKPDWLELIMESARKMSGVP